MAERDPATLPALHVIDVAGRFQAPTDVEAFCDPSHEHVWEWRPRCTACGVVGHLAALPSPVLGAEDTGQAGGTA